MSPHTDENQRHEEHLHRHPSAPEGESEPGRMLCIVLVIVALAGICVALILPYFVGG